MVEGMPPNRNPIREARHQLPGYAQTGNHRTKPQIGLFKQSLGLRRGVRPLGLFGLQLALNGAWTPLFFGLQRPGLAFAEILFLWAAVILTTIVFFRVRRPAGWLMVPYAAWVTFASVLNGAVWRLNS